MTTRTFLTGLLAFAIGTALLGGVAAAQEGDPAVAKPPAVKVLK